MNADILLSLVAPLLPFCMAVIFRRLGFMMEAKRKDAQARTGRARIGLVHAQKNITGYFTASGVLLSTIALQRLGALPLSVLLLMKIISLVGMCYHLAYLYPRVAMVSESISAMLTAPYVRAVRDVAPLEESVFGVGRFWWHINGEESITWDTNSMLVHGLEVEDGVSMYQIDYALWTSLVDTEEELTRIQQIVADAIASVSNFQITYRCRDYDGNMFHVLSIGNVRRLPDDSTMCEGLNVRLQTEYDKRSVTMMDIMSRLKSIQETREPLIKKTK